MLNDTLVADVIDFFTSRNYNTNIVDLLMRIMADALELDVNIYQENQGKLQIVNFVSDAPETKMVQVKFMHDNLHPNGNHYNAIIDMLGADINLNILSTLATDELWSQKENHQAASTSR